MANQGSSRVPSAAASGKHGHTLISDKKFRQLYALTLQVHRLSKSNNGAAKSAGLPHSEAALAGVAADLSAKDVVVLQADTVSASALRESLPGKLIAAPRADFENRVIEALGSAVVARLKKTGAITVIFSAHAAAEPLLREAHALAARAKLPVLFVERGLSDQGKQPAHSPARNHDDANWIPAIPVDAQDVMAIYRVAHESITRAREGSGPTRLQCMPWPVSATGGKTSSTGDPVGHLERWLAGRGLPAAEWRRAIIAEMKDAGSAANQELTQTANHAAAGGWSETAEPHSQTIA